MGRQPLRFAAFRTGHRVGRDLPHRRASGAAPVAGFLPGCGAGGCPAHGSERLRALYPGLLVAGAYDGSPDEMGWAKVAALAAGHPTRHPVCRLWPPQAGLLDRPPSRRPASCCSAGRRRRVRLRGWGNGTRAALDAPAWPRMAAPPDSPALALAADDQAAAALRCWSCGRNTGDVRRGASPPRSCPGDVGRTLAFATTSPGHCTLRRRSSLSPHLPSSLRRCGAGRQRPG